MKLTRAQAIFLGSLAAGRTITTAGDLAGLSQPERHQILTEQRLILNRHNGRIENATELIQRMAIALVGRHLAPTRPGPPRPARQHNTEPARIRAWARSVGLNVPDRGRISHELTDAYHAAHPGAR